MNPQIDTETQKLERNKFNNDLAMELRTPANEFLKLAKQINDSQEAIQIIGKSIEDKFRDLITEVIQCGNTLIQAKKAVGHGKFCEWVKHNIHFSERTAQDYMKISRHAEDLDIRSLSSIRQVLTAIDAIELSNPQRAAEIESPNPAQGDGVNNANEEKKLWNRLWDFAGWFRSHVSAEGAKALPEAQRAKLAEELKPVVDVYNALLVGI